MVGLIFAVIELVDQAELDGIMLNASVVVNYIMLIFDKKKVISSLPLWVLFAVVSCKSPGPDAVKLNQASGSENLADQRWLDKASRALRFGKSLAPNDPLREFAGRPKNEVIDVLFKDPLFFPTMVDFYGFYFGFKADDSVSRKTSFLSVSFDPKTRILKASINCDKDPHCVKYGSFHLNRQLFNHVAALNGAVIISGDRSLDQLFQPIQPPYVSHSALADFASTLLFASLPNTDQIDLAKASVSLDKLKSTLDKSLDDLAQTLKKELDQAKTDTAVSNCEKINASISPQERLIFALESVTETGLLCPPNASLSIHEIRKIQANAVKLRGITKEIFKFLEDYLSRKLVLIRATYFELPEALRGVWKSPLFGETFWSNHPNSSTNYNRRRAAYVLKTFFCDDLTPVNLEIAKHPGDDRHASDPSCMACHYKLDPLAGFFRPYGVAGIRFDGAKDFFFDDLKRISGMELDKYMSSWDFPGKKGPNNGLNVGLVRSSTDQSKNSYGSTLEDMGRLIASDPRTFVCKTQRLADYFIGSGLTYDRTWIEQLASKIQSAPKASNGKAIKEVIKGLLLSKSFMVEDPEDGVCYDRPSLRQGQSNLDCLVSSTLEKYCYKCHGSAGAHGGLNLSQWSEKNGFLHADDDGKNLEKSASYQRILQRLGPSEAGPIMPLNSPMPDPERRILINWFEKQIKASN